MRTSIFAGLKGEGLRNAATAPRFISNPVGVSTDDFINEAIGLAPIRLTGSLRMINTINGRAIVRDE